MTKPTKWLCAQRRLRSAWASAQSDQSLRCVGPKLSSCGQRRLWSDWADAQADLSRRWAHSLLVLSCRGSFVSFKRLLRLSHQNKSSRCVKHSENWTQKKHQILLHERKNSFLRQRTPTDRKHLFIDDLYNRHLILSLKTGIWSCPLKQAFDFVLDLEIQVQYMYVWHSVGPM